MGERGVYQDEREARTIVEAALGIRIYEPFSGLVMFDGIRTIGAAIFNNFNGRDVHFTCVLSTGDVGVLVCRKIAHYIFNVMGCHRVTAVTRSDNFKAIQALKSLGFRYEGTLREHFPGNVDGQIFGLLRSEQRLLRYLDVPYERRKAAQPGGTDQAHRKALT